MLADPKPVKTKKTRKGMSRHKKTTKSTSEAEMAHMGGVKQQPCCGCGRSGTNEAHHCRSDSFGGKRASGYATISLCPQCHRLGVNSFHKNKSGWEAEHGKDYMFIPVMLDRLGIPTSSDFT